MKQAKKIPVAANSVVKAFQVALSFLPDDKIGGKTAQDFMDLKLENGAPLFTASEESLGEIHDLSNMMHRLEGGALAVYTYLQETVIPLRNQLIRMKEKETYSIIIFMAPTLESYRKREEAVSALAEFKGPLTDATSCPSCGEPKVHRDIKQTRSADEGFTSIFECPRCGLTWTEN